MKSFFFFIHTKIARFCLISSILEIRSISIPVENRFVHLWLWLTLFSPLFRTGAYIRLRVKEFSIPRFNSITYGKHSRRYLGPVLCAKIPINIRQSLTLRVFKKAVRGLDLGALVDGEGCEGCSVCITWSGWENFIEFYCIILLYIFILLVFLNCNI